MAAKMLHACLRVMNLEQSLAFYQEGLGLIVTERRDYPEHQFSLVYLAFEAGGYEIELTYNYDQQVPYEIGNGFSHLAIGVDDLEASHDLHQKLGYETTPLKGLPGEKPNYYFVTDPDGYKIEVIRNK